MSTNQVQELISVTARQQQTRQETRLAFEKLAVDLIKTGKTYFDQWSETSLWLACHSLIEKGIVKECVVSNCFEFITRNKSWKPN